MSTGHRWLMGIAGALWLILGVLFFIQPLSTAVITAGTVVLFAGVALIVSGIFEIAAWFSQPKDAKRGWTLAGGIISILLGILLLWQPLVAVLSIPYILAFTLIFRGVVEIAGSFSAKSMGIKNWWIVLIGGFLALILSVFIFMAPFATSVIYFGVFFVGYGILEIIGAFIAKDPEDMVSLA